MTEKLNTISEVLNSIQLSLKVPKDKDNSFGGFKYRNAEGILEAVKKELENEKYPRDCFVKIDCLPKAVGNRVFIKATAILAKSYNPDDNYILAMACAGLDESKKGMDQAQLTGSATSYAKKYALCNLFAIDDSKDDPDADEKPKDGKGKFFKDGAEKIEVSQDEKREKAEEFFKKTKAEIESSFGSLAELEAVIEKHIKGLKALSKYPDLAAMLEEAIDAARNEFKSNEN
jgi:hypothetical protein